MTGHLTAFALMSLAMTGIATASDLAPGSGHSIDLARFNGTIYYTVEPDGFRVVATLAEGEEGLPMRFVATLAESQSIAISVPGRLGEASRAIEISRAGGKLLISPHTETGEIVSVHPQVVDQ